MKKAIVVWDVICYAVFPLIIWNFSREYIGDYYAMLISSVPGVIYTIFRFLLIKKINFLGIFLITNLMIGTLVDVLSGSAIQLLWNQVFYSLGIAFIFTVSIIINKPISLYFFLDVAEIQGYNRAISKKLFYQKKILFMFKLITFTFALRDILLASIKIGLITYYGVEAFDKGIIIRQIVNWGFTGLTILGMVYIIKLLNQRPPKTPIKIEES